MCRTSVMSGRLRNITGSSVSRVAQRIGRTAFLLAEGVIRPASRRPPRTISLLKRRLLLAQGLMITQSASRAGECR